MASTVHSPPSNPHPTTSMNRRTEPSADEGSLSRTSYPFRTTCTRRTIETTPHQPGHRIEQLRREKASRQAGTLILTRERSRRQFPGPRGSTNADRAEAMPLRISLGKSNVQKGLVRCSTLLLRFRHSHIHASPEHLAKIGGSRASEELQHRGSRQTLKLPDRRPSFPSRSPDHCGLASIRFTSRSPD